MLSIFPNFYTIKILLLDNPMYLKPNTIFYALSKQLEPMFGLMSIKKKTKKKKKKKKKKKTPESIDISFFFYLSSEERVSF